MHPHIRGHVEEMDLTEANVIGDRNKIQRMWCLGQLQEAEGNPVYQTLLGELVK